jgi:hypothetical protein
MTWHSLRLESQSFLKGRSDIPVLTRLAEIVRSKSRSESYQATFLSLSAKVRIFVTL